MNNPVFLGTSANHISSNAPLHLQICRLQRQSCAINTQFLCRLHLAATYSPLHPQQPSSSQQGMARLLVLSLVFSLSLFSVHPSLAARYLLQNLPTIPSVPKGTLPPLPAMPTPLPTIPTLPKPTLSPLPSTQIPSTLPNPTLPTVPSVPKVTLPPMPANLPIPTTIPTNMPTIPSSHHHHLTRSCVCLNCNIINYQMS
ncbi:Non-specific serine/threonine protein kinase [Bertholletia excelsa]